MLSKKSWPQLPHFQPDYVVPRALPNLPTDTLKPYNWFTLNQLSGFFRKLSCFRACNLDLEVAVSMASHEAESVAVEKFLKVG